jgi:hypothetical protein
VCDFLICNEPLLVSSLDEKYREQILRRSEMTKITYFNAKNVSILGTKEGRYQSDTMRNEQECIKVFEKDGIRYTGQLVYDPYYEEYQLRDIRKNKRAYVLKLNPNYSVSRL